MSKKVNDDLIRFKNLKILDGNVPKDLREAVESFLEQAVIIGEYNLDFMPEEYLENLLVTMSKYPEYNKLLLDLVRILKRGDIK
tara:strand:- start:855 stop:1106 length:252 start_codon:yes stop_codon:yes gene_type:complete